MGSVMIGLTTEATLMLENSGFVRADFKISTSVFENELKHNGVYIEFQNHVGLPVGKCVPIYITMKPTFHRYTALQEMVNFTILLKVSNVLIVK